MGAWDDTQMVLGVGTQNFKGTYIMNALFAHATKQGILGFFPPFGAKLMPS